MQANLESLPPHVPSYWKAAVGPPSSTSRRHFCTVCGFSANYTCVRCGMRFCSHRCQNVHNDTRCLKFVAWYIAHKIVHKYWIHTTVICYISVFTSTVWKQFLCSTFPLLLPFRLVFQLVSYNAENCITWPLLDPADLGNLVKDWPPIVIRIL